MADADDRPGGGGEPEALRRRLAEVEELYRAAQRLSGVGHWTAAPDSSSSDWSEQMYAVYGLRPGARQPGTDELWKRVHPEDRARVRAAQERLLHGEGGELDYRILSFDGKEKWVRSRRGAIRGPAGEVRLLVGTLQDVTHRHEAEQARLDAQFRSVVDQLGDAVLIHDGAVLVYANGAALAQLGWDAPEQLVGRPVRELFVEEDRAAAAERSRSVALGQPEPPRELRFLRRDGAAVTLELSGLLADFGGKPCIVELGRDVAERKRLQAQVMLADRLAGLGTLAAGVAHEINNPLAYVYSNLELIGETVRELALGQQGPALQNLLVMIEEAMEGAERVRVIVRDLKTFSRTGDESSPALLDPKAALELATKMVQLELRHRCQLVRRFDAVPAVRADRTRLAQVLMNLLLNAAQAIEPGAPEHNKIVLGCATDAEGNAVIAVRDTGQGIPPEVLPRIFDPFFTTKAPGSGTGLGLSVSRSLVAAMGGRIEVESQPGHGSTFRVILPAAAPAAAAPVSQKRVSAPGRRARVLVVDDDAAVGKGLQRSLDRDHDLLVLTSGRAVLELLERDRAFDLLLVDVSMPEMDGIELFGAIGARWPELAERVVFITGGAFTPRMRAFLEGTARKSLEKPFGLQELRALVKAELQRRPPHIPGR